MLVEVDFRRRLDPVSPRAVVDLVQIHRQDFLLGVAVLDLVGDDHLVELASERLLPRQPFDSHVARKLLRDRAAALAFHVAVFDVAEDGAGDAFEIHPLMLIKTLVFKSDRGVLQGFGNVFDGDDFAPLGEELGQRRPVRGVNIGDAGRHGGQINRPGRIMKPPPSPAHQREDRHQRQCDDHLEKRFDARPERVSPASRRRPSFTASASIAGRRGRRAARRGSFGSAGCSHKIPTLL